MFYESSCQTRSDRLCLSTSDFFETLLPFACLAVARWLHCRCLSALPPSPTPHHPPPPWGGSGMCPGRSGGQASEAEQCGAGRAPEREPQRAGPQRGPMCGPLGWCAGLWAGAMLNGSCVFEEAERGGPTPQAAQRPHASARIGQACLACAARARAHLTPP